jgi:hypothetical protein
MTPPHQSDADFRVLHTLRCIGVASGDRVATACGLGPDDTEGRLRYLSGEGLVELGPGPFGGWGLTDEGRIAEHRAPFPVLARSPAPLVSIVRAKTGVLLGGS